MARARKLKVYRTPIGFHDAYVAAPSQKAALDAWGSSADLFARGSAEIVTDAELAREPLAHPGQVVKRSRGSVAEQLAALPADAPAHGRAAAGTRAARSHAAGKKPPAPAAPRPDRDALDAAERRLADLAAAQRAEGAALRERERALAAERRALDRRQENARDAAERAVDQARAAHAKALRHWLESR